MLGPANRRLISANGLIPRPSMDAAIPNFNRHNCKEENFLANLPIVRSMIPMGGGTSGIGGIIQSAANKISKLVSSFKGKVVKLVGGKSFNAPSPSCPDSTLVRRTAQQQIASPNGSDAKPGDLKGMERASAYDEYAAATRHAAKHKYKDSDSEEKSAKTYSGTMHIRHMNACEKLAAIDTKLEGEKGTFSSVGKEKANESKEQALGFFSKEIGYKGAETSAEDLGKIKAKIKKAKSAFFDGAFLERMFGEPGKKEIESAAGFYHGAIADVKTQKKNQEMTINFLKNTFIPHITAEIDKQIEAQSQKAKK